jgi:hypothetical protein
MSFGQCSSSVAGLLNPLLLSWKWMLVSLPHHREYINLHQSAYLDQNRQRARYPHHPRKSPYRQALYGNTYIRPANWKLQQVELWKCYRLRRVGCRAEVESALEPALGIGQVGVHLFLCISSVSADSLRFHFGKEGSQRFGFDEALPPVVVSQPSPFYAQQPQYPAFSLLGPWCLVC